MSWTIRAQYNKPNLTDECEWNAIVVDTQEEADQWWTARVARRNIEKVLHTMQNPQGEIVRILFQ